MAVGAIANALPWQDEEAERRRGRYFGRYLGFVRDRNDPAKTGRVKVHVPAVTADVNSKENWLDWCIPATVGLFVPPLNAPVYVEFEHGMITHGVYSWGWILGSDENSSAAPVAGKGLAPDPNWVKQETFTSGGSAGPTIAHTLTADEATFTLPTYPYNKVYQSESGITVEIDDSPFQPRVRIYHPAGATLLVDANGSIHLRTVGSIFNECGGDYVVALKSGSSYKVIYPNGTSMICGASGFHVSGHQASIMGRTIQRKEGQI